MVALLVIVFREVLEIGLIIGIVLAATRGVLHRGWWIGAGIAGGVVGAVVAASLADRIAHLFADASRHALEAAALTIAVVMLGWTLVWLSARGRDMAAELEQMGRDVVEGRKPLKALAVVIFVAVLREGIEVILFVYGMVAAGRLTTLDVTAGVGLGILYGGAVAGALYLGLGAIPLRHVFKVMSVVITLLAAGLAAQAVGLLQSAGHLPLWSEPVWDTSHILQQGRLLGRILHTLVGYLQQPTGLQIAAYALTIVAILVAMRATARTAAATVRRGDGTMSIS